MVQIPRYINVEVTGCIGMTATCGWQPHAPSLCTNVYSRKQQEPNNFPPRWPKKGEPGSESMCGEGGSRGEVQLRRRLPPQRGRRFSICFGLTGEKGGSGGGLGGEGMSVVCVGARAECGEVGESYLMVALFAFDKGGVGDWGEFPPNAQSQPEVKSSSVKTMSCIHTGDCRVASRFSRCASATRFESTAADTCWMRASS